MVRAVGADKPLLAGSRVQSGRSHGQPLPISRRPDFHIPTGGTVHEASYGAGSRARGLSGTGIREATGATRHHKPELHAWRYAHRARETLRLSLAFTQWMLYARNGIGVFQMFGEFVDHGSIAAVRSNAVHSKTSQNMCKQLEDGKYHRLSHCCPRVLIVLNKPMLATHPSPGQ